MAEHKTNSDYFINIKIDKDIYERYISRLKRLGVSHMGRYSEIARINKEIIENTFRDISMAQLKNYVDEKILLDSDVVGY